MLTSYADWRREEDVDTLCATWKFPEFNLFKEVYPNGPHCVDKQGRPLNIERPGVAQFDRLHAEIEGDHMVKYLVQKCEWFKYHIYPACSLASGRPVESTC